MRGRRRRPHRKEDHASRQADEGISRISSGRFAAERARFAALAERGQRPEIMVIGCIDSRVSPEIVFDAGPGEMPVVRNVANLVPRYEPDRDWQHGTSAAREFAVQALGLRHIVVLGHADCCGIRAFADERHPLSPGDFIGRWMAQIAPAAALGPRPVRRRTRCPSSARRTFRDRHGPVARA
jgi:carbonic anhydrase